MDLTSAVTDSGRLDIVCVHRPSDGEVAVELQDASTGLVLLRLDPGATNWLINRLLAAATQAGRLAPGGAQQPKPQPPEPMAVDQDGARFVPDEHGGWLDAEAR